MAIPFSHLHSIKWRIISIAVITCIGFAAYLSIIVNQSNANAHLLQEIRDQRYPVQAHLLASRFHLDAINREMESAAITGDEEQLQAAHPQAEAFRQELLGAEQLIPHQSAAIGSIIARFDIYYETTTALVTDMLAGVDDYEELRIRGEHSSQLFADATRALDEFDSAQNEEFTQSISAASDSAAEFFLLSLSAGLSTAAMVLFIALYTSRRIVQRIHGMVESLKRIAQHNGDMSVRIKQEGQDEMTELAHWFNTFIQKLETVTNNSTAEIKRIAYTDNLSGLPNRRRLIESLHMELNQSKDEENPLCVFFLDLDNFKPVNDQLGHEGGDELIRQVSARLNEVIFGTTTPDLQIEEFNQGSPVIGRLGGDEFMIVYPGIESRAKAATIADNVKSTVLHPYVINGIQCHIGVSIGISLYPTDAQTAGDIIDCADMAMYDAKNAGKNTYRFYDANVANSFESTSIILNELTNNLGNDEFTLLYQPKYRLSDGSYAGAEALLRWNSKTLGYVQPDEFISVAEKSNLIYRIDEFVLNSVCDQIEVWNERNIDPGRIAVNASAKQIRRADLIETIVRITNNYDITLEQLEVEITETSALKDVDQVLTNIADLRALGIHVAMDDFGAGHSSLKLLMNCQLDSLKLDKSLIDKLQADYRSQSIVRSIITLAESLSIKTVAEGIETEDQHQMLRKIQCDLGQGYYYSSPVSADELEKMITSESLFVHSKAS